MSIRHEARGGLAEGLKQSFTRKEAAGWASDVGLHKWNEVKRSAKDPARAAAVARRVDAELIDMSLADLRRVLGVTSTCDAILKPLYADEPLRIPDRADLARALLTEMALAVVGVASDFLEIEVRDSEGGWSVLLSAKAFDYYGAIFVRAGDLYEHKAAELAGCIDQVAQSILSGRAEHRKGYPRDLLGRP